MNISTKSMVPKSKSDKSNEAIFNKHAATYSDDINRAISFSFQDTNFFTSLKAQLLLDLIKDKIGNIEDLNILDIGCGNGLLHKFFIEAGFKVEGVDIATDSLEIARITNPKVKYQEFNGQTLPFDDGTFDVVIIVCVFHHITPPSRQYLMSEIYRVCRNGGLICIIEHNPLNILTKFAVWRCPFDRDAILLPAKYTLNLIKGSCHNIQELDIIYFLFFPINLIWVRKIEKYFKRFFLGAQYCAYCVKHES